MRTAAGTVGSLRVQCTVLGASLMIWWIFQVYPARTLAFRCDSVLPRVRAFPSWPFVLFMGPLWNSSQLRVDAFPGSVTVIAQIRRTTSFQINLTMANSRSVRDAHSAGSPHLRLSVLRLWAH